MYFLLTGLPKFSQFPVRNKTVDNSLHGLQMYKLKQITRQEHTSQQTQEANTLPFISFSE
jgi:hypothetical protein